MYSAGFATREANSTLAVPFEVSDVPAASDFGLLPHDTANAAIITNDKRRLIIVFEF